MKLTTELDSALGDSIYSKKANIALLINEGFVDLDESDNVVWKNGEEYAPLSEGIDAWKKSNPDVVKASARPGSGGNPQGGGAAPRTITKDQFSQMSGRERSDFFASGGTIQQ